MQASQVVMLIHGSAVHVYEARGNHKALEYATLEELQRRALEAAVDANLPIVRIYEPGTDARHSQHRRGNDPSQSWRSSKGPSSRDESEVDDLEPMSSWTARTMARDGFISPHDPSLPGDLFAWAGGVDFQLLTLASLAERVLLASPAYDEVATLPLYTTDGLVWSTPLLKNEVTVYLSPENPHVMPVARRLMETLQGIRLVNVRTHGRRSKARWLLYVSVEAFKGEAGEKLAFEVVTALKSGVKPIVLFNPDENAFGDVLAVMPRGMLSAGLFGPRTIEWYDGALCEVSVRLVAKALGAHFYAADTNGGKGGGWRGANLSRNRLAEESSSLAKSSLASKSSNMLPGSTKFRAASSALVGASGPSSSKMPREKQVELVVTSEK